ncbi:MAG: AraC family transcriptional regulator [Ruminococcaceae bacterium]|nr:AraC family transcriptional regulator [Oscillospiraceae bacterium]
MKIVYHNIDQTIKDEFYYGMFDERREGQESHFHKNYEILLVVEGKGHCKIGELEYELEKGNLVFISPFQIHSFRSCEGGRIMCIDVHEHIILTCTQIIDGKRLKKPVQKIDKEIFDSIVRGFLSTLGEKEIVFKRISPVSLRLKIKGLCYLLSSELIEIGDWEMLTSTDSVILDIIQYISENFKKDISLKDIACEKGYNYQYLSRTFNGFMGINFKKFLNFYRIEYAYAMIQDTNDSFADIAFESGFQSIRSFDYVCKSVYNLSPSEIRKKQKEEHKSNI